MNHITFNWDAFSDEMEKISFGRSLEQQQKEDPNLVLAKPPPAIARASLGLIGAGSLRMELPIIQRMAAGRGMVYHGTNLGAANDIMNDPEGISPSFAGSGKKQLIGGGDVKASRINRSLMSESLNRLMESRGVPLDYEDLVASSDQFHKLMDAGVKSGPAAEKVFQDTSSRLINKGKMTHQQANEIKSVLGKDLSNYGQRVYTGVHPSDVSIWGGTKSEVGMMQRMQKPPSMTRSIVEALTGGLPSTIEDWKHRAKYKPHTQATMSRAQAAEYLKSLQDAGGKQEVVFGAHIPTGQLGYLEDFPVARRLLEVNPGMRNTLRHMNVQTYEPGRDLSIPHNIPTHNIKHIDIQDAGKIHRINLSDFKKATRSPILKSLGRAAIPTAIAGLGAYNIYRAFKPKKRLVGKNSPYAEDSENTKQASVGSDTMKALKYVGLPMAVAGGIGVGTHALSEKFISRDPVNTKGAKREAEQTARQLGRIGISTLANFGVGAGMGALMSKKLGLPIGTAAALGGGTFVSLGDMGSAAREQALEPEAASLIQHLPAKQREWLREHPSIGAAPTVALAAALPVGAGYTLRKYYPTTFARMALEARRIFKG